MKNCLLKFIFSSFSSFLIDILLFAILVSVLDIKSNSVFSNMGIAVVVSRVVSSHYNYCCNRYFVFKEGRGVVSYVKYFGLVLLIGFSSWLLSSCVVKIFSLENFAVTIAKAVVDLILFCVSYLVQKYYVFIIRR